MAKLSIVAGATSQSVNIFVQNSSVTTGAGLTGFAPANGALLSGMVFYYSFAGANAASVVQSLSVPATVGAAFSAGSIVEIDATHMPGVARLDLPNAMLAASKGRSVVGIITGGTNVAPVVLEIELTGWDNQDAVHGGLSAIPNATAGASGGLLISGSNSGTTTLGALTVTGATTLTGNVSAAAGVTITQSTTNGAGLSITGNGSGAGILSTGGATGHGISATSGATSGNGLNLSGGTLGHGISSTGAGTSKHGMLLTAGGTTANGLAVVGGSTSGAGIQITTTSGDGISSTPTAGHGITLTGQGTTHHGINAAGGVTSSDGIRATGGGTGNGINAISGTGATGDGIVATASSTNGNGVTMTHAGTGKDLNATSTPLTLAKTTNITGFNDIAATAIVSSGAITTSSGKVSEVALVDTLTTYTGNTVQTGDSYARLGAPAGASVSADIAAVKSSVGSPMQAYTQPTGFLAATFPTGTIANTTNITAGTITTATNLTNAPTAGDFTAAMKTSLNNSTPASITGAVGSVTGNVGGNVTGSVGSVVSAVGITSNRKKGSTATFEFLMQDSTTGAPKTGLTVASTLSKDGGTSASTANAVTEIGLGQYQIVLTGTEMTMNNGFLQCTATGALTFNLSIQTQP